MENIETNVNVNEEKTINNENENTNIDNKEVKTFTQEEVNEIVAKRVAKETKKKAELDEKAYKERLARELAESKKLEAMDEAERNKALAEKEKRKFEEEKQRYEEEKRIFEAERITHQTAKVLEGRGLPVALASYIKSNNADEIMDNVLVFEKCFSEAVETAVNKRLRTQGITTSTTSGKGVTKEQFNKMTYHERMAIYSSDRALYEELSK